MEAIAKSLFVGTSPRKMRIVIDLVRGKKVEDALAILRFTPNHAARSAEKTLRSAVANLQNRDDAGRVDLSNVFVKTVTVDGAPMMKRISPAPMGRAYRIRKRSHHLTFVVALREPSVKASAAPKPAAEKSAEPKAKAPRVKKEKTAKSAAKKQNA